MKIIERIEIHRFRSISDAAIITDELTIFSGINNSGKSNILRALNLFFNNETSFLRPYEFSKDYNRAFTGQAGGKRMIKITLHFPAQGKAALNAPFSISRTFEENLSSIYDFCSTNPVVQSRLEKNDGNIRRQFTAFLNKIEFFYIPAVRDKDFVQSLFLNFEKLIENDKSDEFEDKIKDLSGVLKKKSEDISNDFEEFIGLPTEAVLSSEITDILGAVEINVDSGIEVLRRIKNVTRYEKVKVNLFSSGDGILMSYLAYFLAHICKKLPNRRFVWGFEEPENSLEYSKSQKLAADFNTKFRKNAQILITTHSPAFINLKDEKNSAFYRVYIKPDDKKRATEVRTLQNLKELQQSLFKKGTFSTEYELIQKELGFVEFALEIESTLDSLINEQKIYAEKSAEFKIINEKLLASHPEKIFICEDSCKNTILLWEKLLAIFHIDNVKVISSEGSSNDNAENGIAYQQSMTNNYMPLVLRQVDRDGMLDHQIDTIRNNIYKKFESKYKYLFLPLPVCEIENFYLMKDDNFDESNWYNNKDDIEEAFEKTADAIIKKFDKKLGYENGTGFRANNQSIGIMHEMRTEARNNWRKYMPGKSIAKKMADCNPIQIISSWSIDEMPEDLVLYMRQVESFFADNS